MANHDWECFPDKAGKLCEFLLTWMQVKQSLCLCGVEAATDVSTWSKTALELLLRLHRPDRVLFLLTTTTHLQGFFVLS